MKAHSKTRIFWCCAVIAFVFVLSTGASVGKPHAEISARAKAAGMASPVTKARAAVAAATVHHARTARPLINAAMAPAPAAMGPQSTPNINPIPLPDDTPIFSTAAISAGCNADDLSDGTDGARVSPEWTPVIHDPTHPFPNDPVTILEGRVMNNIEKFQDRSGLPQEALTDQSPSEVAEEDIPWIHYTHDKTIDVVPDPGYQHLLSQHLSNGIFVTRKSMEVEWENGGVGGEENTSFIDNIWGALPEWAFASVGDRVWIAGRWIFDCGHPGLPDGSSDQSLVGYETEIHPPRAMVVFRNHRLSLQFPNFSGDGGTGGEPNTSIWLPITGGDTAIPVTEADAFVSGFGGAAQDICSITNNGISKTGDSNYGDCVHSSPVIAVNDRNYVFDIYPPGTDFNPKDKLPNGTWPVMPPVPNAALQWTVIDRLASASWIPSHACGKGPDSVSSATCYTVEPLLCLVDGNTPAPNQNETACPDVPASPTRLRVILPFQGSNANIFARSILLGWDDVPTAQNTNQTYNITLHKYTVGHNGEGVIHHGHGDFRVYVDVGGQWRYISNPEFFDKNQDGDNVCNGDALTNMDDNDCFQFDNHPWFMSVPAGSPIHVSVGGYESDSVDGFLCWEKDNYFNGGDCNFSTLGGLALAEENDDRLGSLEFDLDPQAAYQEAVPGSVTYDVSVNGLTLETTQLDQACRDLKDLTGGFSGVEQLEEFLGLFSPCGQDGVNYKVEFNVIPVLSPDIAMAGNLGFGTPSFTNPATNTTFVTGATPLSVSTNFPIGKVGFQYRFVPDNGLPPTFLFGLPFPFHWLWTDFAQGPRVGVTLNSSAAGFGGDGGYTAQYSAVRNDCDNLFACAVTEPRHSAHFVLDNTPPVATIVQPTATSYGRSNSLTLSFSVSDGTGSGVKSVTPKMDGQTAAQFGANLASGQTLYLYSMSLGPHTFSVDSVDNVDNAGTNSVTFTITVTADSLKGDVSNLSALGCIDNIAQSLTAKISAAQDLIGKGQTQAAVNTLAALIQQIEAQAGKHISASCQDPNGRSFDPIQLLLEDARYLQISTAGQLAANPILGWIVDSAGAAIGGVTVNLLDASSNVIGMATTDVTGFYYFANTSTSGLTSGANYALKVSIPTGYTSSTPATLTFTWSATSVVGNFALN